MDYNSHNGEHLHGHPKHHHRSRNRFLSSALLASICKSTEDDGGMMDYKNSRRQVEIRDIKAENNRLTRNSRIEKLWDEDPRLNNEKSMRGGSAKMGVFNAEKYEAEAEYTKRKSEFHLSFQSKYISSAPSCSSDYTSDTSSISRPYFSSDAETLYTHTSSIPTADKTRRNSHNVAGRGNGAGKWGVGGESSHGKSTFRDGDFRSTEKPFISVDHHGKIKSKSKIGKDSKKPTQPISPGRKLANFFNSMFMAGGTKKTKLSFSSSVSDSNSYDSSERKPDSLYLSPSSVQIRPCLSKTSRGSNNSSDRMSQKSVTFYPTAVILDEDSRPCGEKCLQNMENYPQITHTVPNPNPSNYPHITHPSTNAYKFPLLRKELKKHIVEEEIRHAAAAATAKELIAKYQKSNSKMETVAIRGLDKPDEGEEEDDGWSCSSSELFELENLAAIDMKMDVYQKELPVYETTHIVTNKAIAKRLICD